MYQCQECKKTFIHTAKQTALNVAVNVDLKQEENITVQTQNTSGFETQVCPYCKSLNYTEYDEPKPEISSVVSVDLSQVDGYLAKGYVVHELYARTATLIKKEVKQ